MVNSVNGAPFSLGVQMSYFHIWYDSAPSCIQVLLKLGTSQCHLVGWLRPQLLKLRLQLCLSDPQSLNLRPQGRQLLLLDTEGINTMTS